MFLQHDSLHRWEYLCIVFVRLSFLTIQRVDHQMGRAGNCYTVSLLPTCKKGNVEIFFPLQHVCFAFQVYSSKCWHSESVNKVRLNGAKSLNFSHDHTFLSPLSCKWAPFELLKSGSCIFWHNTVPFAQINKVCFSKGFSSKGFSVNVVLFYILFLNY